MSCPKYLQVTTHLTCTTFAHLKVKLKPISKKIQGCLPISDIYV